MIEVLAGTPLTELVGLNPVFRGWLNGHQLLGAAGADWERFRSGAEPNEPGPIWSDREWYDSWRTGLLAELPDDEARSRAARNLVALRSGRAEVVITGQQPGFLGGPLYTVWKAAACIAFAERRSAAGRPTLPVFWLAEDDDDRREAFAPLLFDPRRRVFLKATDPGGPADRRLGPAPAAVWGRGGAGWLSEQAGRNRLAGDLAALWCQGASEGLGWGPLQRRALLRFFAGTDLLVVSGDDPSLHQTASPLYTALWERQSLVRELARERGRELGKAGLPAQVGPGGLVRLFHLVEGDRRLGLPPVPGPEPPSFRQIRPGVAARSLIQDWLFRPAGVVVGPGELAYLKQLEPVFQEFGLRRSPLLPRLFANLITVASAPLAGRREGERTRDSSQTPDLEALAGGTVAGARKALDANLRALGVSPQRVAEVVDGWGQRWRQAVQQLLERELSRERQRRADRRQLPPWIPAGEKRLERTLAAYWAGALWGDELAGVVLAAARAHVEDGGSRNWREYQLVVPQPKGA